MQYIYEAVERLNEEHRQTFTRWEEAAHINLSLFFIEVYSGFNTKTLLATIRNGDDRLGWTTGLERGVWIGPKGPESTPKVEWNPFAEAEINLQPSTLSEEDLCRRIISLGAQLQGKRGGNPDIQFLTKWVNLL